ncbi:SMI1/KNR4 family protein [Bacillus pseudomycoides]|nr:SMI1/KNR4 family protein [Bacillus pseudomycoides]PGA94960.1 SMI1/KNR4 family protein [Bacillus pseudomycoides]PHF35104.1 SMI1/KNR4 family protein [Bacillus pseudomycoides]
MVMIIGAIGLVAYILMQKGFDIKVKNQTNQEISGLYMPFDCLLFIADAGNGDLFAYSILNGSIQKDDIYVWNHENDSRTWVAPSLKKFIKWWSDGTISV